MSKNILHVVAGTRMNNASVIVGDRAALDDALATGSGGTTHSLNPCRGAAVGRGPFKFFHETRAHMKRLVAMLALASAGASAQIPVVGGPIDVPQQIAQARIQMQAAANAAKALPASGSPDAARLAGIRFVNVMFGVPAEKIEAVVEQSTATSALVRANYPSQQCNLTLVKNATANEYGWTVQLHKCEGKS